jgi:hypothetical protein
MKVSNGIEVEERHATFKIDARVSMIFSMPGEERLVTSWMPGES